MNPLQLLQSGFTLMLDFRRLPGGAFNKALPASQTLCVSSNGRVSILTSYYGLNSQAVRPLLQSISLNEVHAYLREAVAQEGFCRLSYVDSTGFKETIALDRF